MTTGHVFYLFSSYLAEMEGFEKIMVRLGPALAGNSPPDCCIRSVQIPPLFLTNKKYHPVGWYFLLAEMEGFEPPHALRRLADFESAPFSHLGTSP